EGKHRRRGARLGAQAAAGAAGEPPHSDDDFGRCAGGRFHLVGERRQLSRATSALDHRGYRDALAGRADRHRHRPRRHPVLPACRHHRRRRGAWRRHDREARRAVRREYRARAGDSRPAKAARVTNPAEPYPRRDRHERRNATAGLVVAAIAAAHLLVSLPAPAQPQMARTAEPPISIEVRAKPIAAFEPRDPSRHRFGQLQFRGGLELTSPYKEFGGLSAIRVAADGARFLSLTDQGRWLRGRIVYDGTRPAGIADAEMAPILGADGKPLASRRWFDTESIAQDGGTLYVGIERVHQIVRLDYGRFGLLARGQPIPVPPGMKQLPSNGSIEALEFLPKGQPLAGTLIALSERGYDDAGNLKAWLIGGPSPGTFAVRRTDDF